MEDINNYQDPQDTNNNKKQDEDSDIKKWKGMKEDPKTGKFIVYITESEEFVFDSAEQAIDFMVSK